MPIMVAASLSPTFIEIDAPERGHAVALKASICTTSGEAIFDEGDFAGHFVKFGPKENRDR